MALHAHREGHLLFHIDGPAPTVTVSDVAYKVDANKGVAVSTLQPHSFTPAGPGFVRFLVLYIDHAWFNEQAGNPHGPLVFGSNAFRLTEEIRRQVAAIVEALSCGQVTQQFDVQLLQLAQSCNKESFRNPGSVGTGIGAGSTDFVVPRDHRIRKSMTHLKQLMLGEDVNLDSVAAQAGLSRPHFYRLFRENLGLTPNVYLNILRMEVAIERLIKTDQPVTSIGLDLGFASQASFTRFFGANVGIPPTDYRRVAQIA